MTAWRRVPLEAVCEVIIGRTPSRSRRDFWGPGHAWLSIADMNQGRALSTTKETITDRAVAEAKCRLVSPGTVVMSFKLSIGKVGVTTIPLFTNEAIAALPIRDRHDLSPGYLYWALQAMDLTSGSDRAAMGATLNKDKLLNLTIPVPPLAEQHRIAAILDQAESLRARRRTVLRQLGRLPQSIFLGTFGDPATNPRKWPIEPVSSYVAAFKGGKSFEADSGGEHTARNRVLKISAVTGMTFRPYESKPAPDDYTPPPEHFVRPGDLLISRANTAELVGAIAYVDATPDNVILPDKLWRFVWREPNQVEPLFVWSLFQTRFVRRELSSRATGTGGSMKNISQKKLLLMRTILPPIEIQRGFVERLTSVKALIGTHTDALAKLDALFASLQHRAFRGEL